MSAAPNLKLVPDTFNETISDDLAAATALELAEVTRAIEQTPPDEPDHYNDLNNAERFVAAVDGKLLYVPETDRWLYWNGTHWTGSGEQDHAFELICAFVKKLLISDTASKEARQNAKRANDTAGISAIEKLAKRMLQTPLHEFDGEQTHYMLNCKNGTVNLRTGEINDHNSENLITRMIPVDYDESAECPKFDKFLAEIQPDPEIRRFLQRSIGYSLIGAVPEHAFWILYGIGNNGKSVFTKLFINLLGPYASGMQAESLMDSANKRTAGAASEDIARLKSKRFILVSESNEGERLNAAQIKALSAGDVVTARELFKGSFDFSFTGKLWIATNHKPAISDHSKGLWRRVKLVPFAQNIADDKVIKQDELHAMLRLEFSGILNWAVQGCLDYIEHDSLRTPPVIQAEIDAYKYEQDSIAQFLEEHCQTVAQGRTVAQANGGYFNELDFRAMNSDVYARYRLHCKDNGEFPFKQKRFSQMLIEKGFKKGNSGGRYWEGLRLTGSDPN